MKILRFTDDTPNVQKSIDESKIFIALVRSLGFMRVFLERRVAMRNRHQKCRSHGKGLEK